MGAATQGDASQSANFSLGYHVDRRTDWSYRMTDRERILATFRGEPVDRIVWQPRLEHWFGYNQKMGSLPERYREMDLFELYDDLGCSVRYAGRALRRAGAACRL